MGTQQPFQLPVTNGKTFTKQTVVMDGKRFQKCTFIDCTLVYRGTGPGETSECVFYPDTVWAFQGMAATIVETLQRYGFQFRFGREDGQEPVRFPNDAM